MLKFTLILITILILGVSGKLTRSPAFLDSYNDVEYEYLAIRQPEVLSATDTVWVLNLDGDLIDPLKIRVANAEEAEQFAADSESLIDSFERRPKKPARKPQPKPVITDSELKSLKSDITRTVNKFILYTGAEPDVELTNNHNQNPIITLFFRGPYSSLILKHGSQQWHFFINPPSPLPSWFYERPSGGKAEVSEIPEDVEREFFRGLLLLLKVFLSQPL